MNQMTEYVDKEIVKEAIEMIANACLANPRITRGEIQTFFKGIPTADVRPARRGRWIQVSGFFTPGGDPLWKCSECGKGRHVYGIEHGSYGADVSDGQWVACPNCAAIMNGGDNDG